MSRSSEKAQQRPKIKMTSLVFAQPFLCCIALFSAVFFRNLRLPPKHETSDYFRRPALIDCFTGMQSMDSASSSSASTGTIGRRGIPATSFVEDVQNYLTQLGLDVNSTLAFLQERLQQYKMAEIKLLAQQRDLQAKIPDIEKCLAIVNTLQAKKGSDEPILADFEVSEGIYSQARIEDTDSVCLWLGANVMLEYSCEEATALLKNNLENAKGSLEVLIADLQFLRDQTTITQVTIARVYNWDVHQRRVRQAAGSKE